MDSPHIEMIPGPAGDLAVALYGDVSAAAAPLLLIHPINTGGGIWRRVAAALSLIRPVIVPDLRGHGGSHSGGPFTVFDHAGDMTAVLTHYRLERFHVAGGSLGGAISVLLAAEHHDRVLSMASFGGSLTIQMPDEAMAPLSAIAAERGGDALMRELLPSAFGEKSRVPAMIEEAFALSSGRDGDLIVSLIRAAFSTDVTAQAAKVRAPALIVNGTQDETCPPSAGTAMACAMGGRAVALDGIGHLPMLEVSRSTIALLADHCAKAEYARG